LITTWDPYLRCLRLPLLMLVLFKSYSLAELWFSAYDPFRVIFGLHWISEPAKLPPASWAVMGLFLLLSLVWRRFWCKYFCPLGLVVQVLSKISWLRLRWSPTDCVACGLCSKNCPLALEVTHPKLHATACNNCLQCVAVCPRPKALEYRAQFAGPTALTVAGVTVFVLVLLGAQLTGWWNPRIGSDPSSIKGWMTLGYIAATYRIPLDELKAELGLPAQTEATAELRSFETRISEFSTEHARESVARLIGRTGQKDTTSADASPTNEPASGTPSAKPSTAPARDPVEIKGKLTLKEVSAGWRIPMEQLLEQLGLPENAPTELPIRESEASYGVDGAKVREAVQTLSNCP
jgi:ferredoxin